MVTNQWYKLVIYSICPMSGQIVCSNQSFHIYLAEKQLQFYIYRFVGQEVFYLVLGHWKGSKLCFYLPSQELILWFLPKDIHLGKQIINTFKSYMVSYWSKVINYIYTSKPKQKAVTYGGMSNIAHYFWNDVTGIEYLAANNCLHKVDKFVPQHFDYYHVANLFPEITTDKLDFSTSIDNLFVAILDKNYFSMRVTNTFITKKLANKIYQVSLEKCSEEKSLFSQIEKSRTCFPLLWIGIRTHHRCWVSQVEGISNILNQLYQDYPNLGVVFDGWGKIHKNQETAKDDSNIKREMEIVNSIQATINSEISIYNAIGLTNFEKAVWANVIDLYIVPEGAGLVHVLWIANKPGVVHTNIKHLKQCNNFWFPNRENAIKPIFISSQYIKNDRSSRKGNYYCDWEELYRLTWLALKNINPCAK